MPRTRSAQPSPTGPVRLGPEARAALRPAAAEVSDGFWYTRREVNARTSIPQGPGLLESAGNLHNLRLAAPVPEALSDAAAEGGFEGSYPFVDTDVYKWLEAAAWQLAQGPSAELEADVERIISLVAAAQQPDGYLNTWFQLVKDGERYQDLRWGHELYCAGHLIQAGVAHHRATGRT